MDVATPKFYGIITVMGQSHGFWTKKDEWIAVEDDHLSTILDDPERFGLTRAHIEEIYASTGQEVGSEGPARDEIMKQATENGWLRVRRFNNVDTRLVVQGTNIDSQIGSVSEFVTSMIAKASVDGSATVVITDFAGGDTRSFHVGASGITSDIEGDLTSE